MWAAMVPYEAKLSPQATLFYVPRFVEAEMAKAKAREGRNVCDR